MAQSRLYKFMNVFERMDGLLKGKALDYDKRPVWFDVVKMFPPKWSDYLAPAPKTPIQPIFYAEDIIRARFFTCFGSPGVIDLTNPDKVPPSEIFIENYKRIAQDDLINEDEAFEITRKELNERGFNLRYRPGQEIRVEDKSTGARLMDYLQSSDDFSENEKNV